MKQNSNSFDDYLTNYNLKNFHPELDEIKEKVKKNSVFPNLIVYGPCGSGKYTQTLSIISNSFNNDLKYEKKMWIKNQKDDYYIKISDIHYEVDMYLLGCNAKQLWSDIFIQIKDSIEMSTNKFGIIVCKNFHNINNELLEIFYSFMQNNNFNCVIKYILITEHISFINKNIIQNCSIVSVEKVQNKYLKYLNKKYKNTEISNLKNVISNTKQINKTELIVKNLYSILNKKDLDYMKLRENIYDLFIYEIPICNCIMEIMKKINLDPDNEEIGKILISMISFFKYYNNNYRPITHVEKYLINMSKLIKDKENNN
tara:strand:- start:371 stop:1312 length:942 start_codon:yes stop_codon:yes gene_type:complete